REAPPARGRLRARRRAHDAGRRLRARRLAAGERAPLRRRVLGLRLLLARPRPLLLGHLGHGGRGGAEDGAVQHPARAALRLRVPDPQHAVRLPLARRDLPRHALHPREPRHLSPRRGARGAGVGARGARALGRGVRGARAAHDRSAHVSRRFWSNVLAVAYREARDLLQRGKALAVLVIPKDFRRDVERGRPQVQLLLDGSDPLSAARIGAYVAEVAGAFATRLVPASARHVAPRLPGPIDVRQRFWFNPTLSDRVFFLAAFAGMLLTNLCLSVTSGALVGEREMGT